MPEQNNSANNAVSCYKEAAQFSASFVTLLFAIFDKICGMAINFVFFFHQDNTNYP